MTTLQLVILAGALVGFGISLLVWRLLPADPDLKDALDRLSPHQELAAAPVPTNGRERLGAWSMRVLPARIWIGTPSRELALLRIPLTRFYGEKLAFATIGLLLPALLGFGLRLLGTGTPLVLPAGAAIALAAAMFFIPDYNARDDAKKARREFTHALSAYVDLVALERNSGVGARQAMESAAAIGDSWVFQRLSEELARSRWSGLPPWDALHTLALELGLPDLDEFANTMRLAGEEGISIYTTLRARSTAIRTAILNGDLKEANAVGERMSIPAALLGVIFVVLMVTPMLLRMFAGT